MRTYNPQLPSLIGIVRRHGSMRIADVAQVLQTPVLEIRAQINAYCYEARNTSLAPDFDVAIYIEPAEEGQLSDDDLVKVAGNAERDLLGLERFDASVFMPLYDAASDLAVREPDNEALRAACEKLLDTFLPGVQPRRAFRSQFVADLQRAIDESRKVWLTYSRAWQPGTSNRVIEPYKLHQTARGYEVDAGPVTDGRLRTFLVSGIRSLVVLDEPSSPPADLETLISNERTTTTVSGYVTHHRAWAVKKWAEDVTYGRADHDGHTFTAKLLPPVGWRVALMMIDAGDGLDLDQTDYNAEAADLAARLLAHHGLDT